MITQQALQTFQDEMQKVLKDPYKVRPTSNYVDWEWEWVSGGRSSENYNSLRFSTMTGSDEAQWSPSHTAQ